ncbi:uncharacterized protein LOC133201449 [Saccostrea echinata]|uniref:uncharacterized protein LOC133201449 n=1 Tax=Saccostrea echinata TaxID=191078 RepID=UPI002A7EFA9F|nr:uncharacterized protein LOC133201449 [Saccostrea echinata]
MLFRRLKVPQSACFCRLQHSFVNKETPKVVKNRLSKRLVLRTVQPSERKSRDLVLLFEWLYPNSKAVDKYCMLYHELGLNVLTIHGQLQHFLWPSQSAKLSQELLTFLKHKRNPEEDKYIVHAFSVGAYNFTTCSMQATSQRKDFGFFRDNIRAQIFDSIVAGSYDHMSTGIGEAFSLPRPLRKPLQITMDSFYKLTKKHTTNIYDDMVNHFWQCPVKVPTLLIYSENDPMCDPSYMENRMTKWQKDFPDFDVTSVSWKKSVHAAHIKIHPEDYMRHWRILMSKVGHGLSEETKTS